MVQILGFPRNRRYNKNMNEKQTLTEDTVRPTKKQKEMLAYIEQFIGEHGYSPSYREIMNGLDYTSVATVALHVRNLIARGHLRKRDHSARSLEVVSHEAGAAAALMTNEVKPAEEKWLVEKVEYKLQDIEAMPTFQPEQLEDLYIVVGALRVLGLDGAVQSFLPRLSAVKQRQM